MRKSRIEGDFVSRNRLDLGRFFYEARDMRYTLAALVLLVTLTACVGTPASSTSETPTQPASSAPPATPSSVPTVPPETVGPETDPPGESPDDAAAPLAIQTVSGFDAKITWDACVAAGSQKYPFDAIYDYEPGLTIPSVTSLDPNGGPSVDVTVKYKRSYQGKTFDSVWICQMYGDPTAPTVAVVDVPDK
jgi:hypothetical protein